MRVVMGVLKARVPATVRGNEAPGPKTGLEKATRMGQELFLVQLNFFVVSAKCKCPRSRGPAGSCLRTRALVNY